MAEQRPDIQVDPAHWKIIADILNRYLAEHEIWAFGSRARHTAKAYSDLDLAVITEHPLSLSLLASVNDAFSESDLPWRVDLLDWATLQGHFRQIIERDHCIIQQRPR